MWLPTDQKSANSDKKQQTRCQFLLPDQCAHSAALESRLQGICQEMDPFQQSTQGWGGQSHTGPRTLIYQLQLFQTRWKQGQPSLQTISQIFQSKNQKQAESDPFT